MQVLNDVLFFAVAFFASVVATITGFGSAMILTPFTGLIINLKEAIVLVAFFHCASNLSRSYLLKRNIDKRLVALYGLPSIGFAFLGALLFQSLEAGYISILFGLFIILFSVFSLFKPSFKLPSRDAVLVGGGCLSGFTSGLIGLGGAVRSIFLISTSIGKEAYIATSAAIAVIVDLTRIGVYLYNLQLSPGYYFYVAPLVVTAFLGAYAGRRFLARLPERAVKRVVLVALILIGLRMVLLG